MTAKHTKGPWFIGSECNDMLHSDCQAGEFREVSGPNHGALAIVVWRMEDDKESPICEANAKLIASAPDLLAALHAAKHYIDNDVVLQQVFAAIELAGEKP